jgi:DNA-binding NarL/FixJ family response regulator
MFKALIVEDDPLFRQILKEILASRCPSISIKEAAHGVEALRELDMNHLDLIFMDIKLPGMNGLELTKRIKESHPGIPVIILTNHDTPEYRKAAFECGADYFISKASSIEQEIEMAVQSISARGHTQP